MKRWMQKIFVAMIAVLTLGLYIPQPPVDLDHDSSKGEIQSKSGTENKVHAEATVYEPPPVELESADAIDEPVDFAFMIKEQAKQQAEMKLGPRIASRIDVDFNRDILPEIETVLDTLITKAGDENAAYYSITEEPASGFGEMIFNVYDERSQEDIARFHVRRDNRPQEGYWFNFHYHLNDDHFETHHTLGDIYWDKNTPPKWMA
ncbi:uncharacterized protein JNUCC1_01392 [Lentibacillus sp. JNUCC-1]|uniref:YpjP family protein n=1 Tax=Lentibacillus sp. JNUCC-1 TaxID=2654513 RepID=UPI0012E73613|nr:YpjP family protein [Lentibacillus sp. JNUCC-1]MUV37586.1 uncharacterized protein [Lentibacillus sp. JNUCC-1]